MDSFFSNDILIFQSEIKKKVKSIFIPIEVVEFEDIFDKKYYAYDDPLLFIEDMNGNKFQYKFITKNYKSLKELLQESKLTTTNLPTTDIEVDYNNLLTISKIQEYYYCFYCFRFDLPLPMYYNSIKLGYSNLPPIVLYH